MDCESSIIMRCPTSGLRRGVSKVEGMGDVEGLSMRGNLAGRGMNEVAAR